MRSAGTWLKENLVDPVVHWVKELFGIHSPSTVFAEIGTFLIDGLLQEMCIRDRQKYRRNLTWGAGVIFCHIGEVQTDGNSSN